MRVIIIGGVAGGATTAARLRRNDEKAEIIIFERGPFISYANCGMPYYLGGVITERDRLFVHTPASFRAGHNIDVRINTEVLSIDRKSKTVRVREKSGGREYEEHYDKLVLSPGAEPLRPNLPGIDSHGVFTIRSVDEMDRIGHFIATEKPRHAVIIGAGFIGLEMAENFAHRGLAVTIVEMAEQVMTMLDFEIAAEVHQHLKSKNVEFFLNEKVTGFERRAQGLSLRLASGRILQADMVLLSLGVRPENKLAKDAGLTVGERGGITVNEFMATSDPDIYAVGDAVEFPHPVTGARTLAYLAGPANKQGRIAADNIVFGNTRAYRGTAGTAIAKVFDITVGATGLSEKSLRAQNLPFASCITHTAHHAGYYPDAKPVSIKITFNPKNGQLYGAQAVGYEGVDKRIDLFSAVIGNRGTVYDLGELEHAYAPPYSSAKDPVNIIGFVAENIIAGKSRHIRWKELESLNPGEYMLVDVRLVQEYELGHIPGAINLPLPELRTRISELPRNKKIIVYCGVGHRAYFAERILRQNDFDDVANLSGGYKIWEYVTQKQSNEDIFTADFIGKDDTIYQADVEAAGRKDSVRKNLDACGLQCPGPIMKLKDAMDGLSTGDVLTITATDPGFKRDVASWCSLTGNVLSTVTDEKGVITAVVEKGTPRSAMRQSGNDATIIVFSASLDRALASFVLANGALAAGKKVTMFFTFWGLTLLRKGKKVKVKKDIMGKMFGMMLPRGAGKLGLSKMNFGGAGALMMKGRMGSLNIDPVETMLAQAVSGGARLIACQMSMDVMGIRQEELIDGVEIGGVASYMDAASDAGVNLFL